MDYEKYFSFRNLDEAIEIQNKLAKKIVLQDKFSSLSFVGGADASSKDGKILGVIVVLEMDTLRCVEVQRFVTEEKIPYIPTFLSFREGLSIVKCWENLRIKPDILIVDGQGYAHPRRLGIASHIGVVLDIPTIGCAKKPLVGNFKIPGNKRGEYEYIYHRKEVVGIVLRTKENVKPVFVSPGHKVSLESAREIILKTIAKYRLPEPIRWAHYYSLK
ncbi:MAG: endonuclease V [Dictyoglomus sp. NZ13-RE01]|nr:MAG: endonuclease V [Dictyoglomus sp. NZ13-RE01]